MVADPPAQTQTQAQVKPKPVVVGNRVRVGSLEEVLEFLEEAGNNGYYINISLDDVVVAYTGKDLHGRYYARIVLKSGVIVDVDAYGNVRVESAHECYCGDG